MLARGMFLNKMAEIGFLHPDHAPTPEAARAFPVSIPLPSTERRVKTIMFFHDESTFQANDDQTTMWGKKGEHMLPAKSKGSGIMVSDFVDERCGYLALTDEENLAEPASCIPESGSRRVNSSSMANPEKVIGLAKSLCGRLTLQLALLK